MIISIYCLVDGSKGRDDDPLPLRSFCRVFPAVCSDDATSDGGSPPGLGPGARGRDSVLVIEGTSAAAGAGPRLDSRALDPHTRPAPASVGRAAAEAVRGEWPARPQKHCATVAGACVSLPLLRSFSDPDGGRALGAGGARAGGRGERRHRGCGRAWERAWERAGAGSVRGPGRLRQGSRRPGPDRLRRPPRPYDCPTRGRVAAPTILRGSVAAPRPARRPTGAGRRGTRRAAGPRGQYPRRRRLRGEADGRRGGERKTTMCSHEDEKRKRDGPSARRLVGGPPPPPSPPLTGPPFPFS